ncbi:MAG: hypothetical protein BGO96_08885 [Micrococcales bacterium 73-15]|uniref:hypothetical protein n=1 Tax=Salana multivorans TaxID=120377 RepID=UPI0009619D18|nr:hypothetical protein [Salana multivorans]OJX95715.1 MAG: hypothetical protein BGO96_08885 [Micrococcales bacterium 73-15]
MSTSPTTVPIEERLRALAPAVDAAVAEPLDPAGFAAARARIDAELASSSPADGRDVPDVVALDGARERREAARRPHRTARRVALGAAAAVAAGLTFAVWPSPSQSAYATWSPTPDPIGDAERAAIVDDCLAELDGPGAPESLWTIDTTELSALVAERRGDWSYVMFAGPPDSTTGDATHADCMLGSGDHEDDVGVSVGIGPAPASIDATQIRYTGGGSSYAYLYDGPVPWISSGVDGTQHVFGVAGSDVARVTVTFSGGLEIEATLSEAGLATPGAPAYWAAWWPVTSDADVTLTVSGYLADGTLSSTEEVVWTSALEENPTEIEGTDAP